YASLVNINAYHQPGVEAGKEAAGDFLALLTKVRGEISTATGADTEDVYHCLTHLANNGEAKQTLGNTSAADTFTK
ncbi:MAG: glucose-6-phosphate isomerase, partial [Verrucomicrobiales bacterium]